MNDIAISEEISNKLANLGFVAACLVVTIHIPTDGYFKLVLSCGIAQAMVPIFFVISGLFAWVSVKRHGWKKLLHGKFFSLVLPYVLLNLIVYGLACLELWCGREWSFSPKMTKISFSTLLLSLGIAKTRWCFLYPLWYVRCLILIFCLLPVIWQVLSKGRRWTILVLGSMVVIDFTMMAMGWGNEKVALFSYWFSTTGLLCFTIGLLIGRHIEDCRRVCSKYTNLVGYRGLLVGGGGVLLGIGACLVASRSGSVAIGGIIQHYCVLPIVAVSLYVLMPTRRFPNWLIRNTFGLYALHAVVIHYAGFMNLPIGTDVGRCVMWFGVVVVSVALSEVLHRTFPGMSRVIFGGR